MCRKPSVSRPEIENPMAGPQGVGSGPEHPQCLASLPFPDAGEAGFEVDREGGGTATAVS